ncbi:MAG TPA: UDP-N-acetylglucosamine 2-epimerase (non-hydrolyzing) [Candidatus Nanoarchaeia archaeon]|nr:UDP-N-acetylglucosamine 2-epimerase (non-hydrolyzing) [Candidatus Nanoarchaeia archaeon]
MKVCQSLKFCVLVGTRPEIIKMSSIIRFLEKKNRDFFILHTGQHYSINMDRIFFDELELPQPKHNLEVGEAGSGSHAKQTALMLERIESVLLEEKPDVLLVQGDTNTVLAGALAASKIGVKVCHVEAGLRSYDRKMPEEINRVMADHLSDLLFAPTNKSANILLMENVKKEKIFVTGNTIVDAVLQNLKISEKKKSPLEKLGLEMKKYVLVTAHRQENVDSRKKLESIISGLKKIAVKHNLKVVYPVHPRTKNMIKKFRIRIPKELFFIEPVGYLDFLQLEKHAKVILTDSGGLQEEACILNVPCITLRENTERPETLESGANILVGTDSSSILNGFERMIMYGKNWKNPFGDGKSGERIIKIIEEEQKKWKKS